MMPKTLIVPVDGSRTADHAFRCAQRLAAHLEPCDIIVMTASTDAGDSRRAHLDTLVRDATETRIRAELVAGEPADAIVRMTAECADPVVCMTTRGRGRLTAPVLGSVATEVVRRVEAPVLLVGPQCEQDWWHSPAKLVACWADEDSSEILAPAQEWSDALGMELWLETVLRPEDIRADFDPQRVFAPARALLDKDPADVHTVALHHQSPARAIVRSAEEFPATLLAMTTRARVGLERAALGSVATDVVRHSPCPVLVVRGP
jgi:nucleotide-binding universal stress UspA family protein